MIQRPQSLLLALIIVLMLASLFLPNWTKVSADGLQIAEQTAFKLTHTQTINGQPEVKEINRFYLGGMMLLVAGMAGFSISRFKNRLLQMKLGFGISLGLALTLVVMMMGIKEGEAFFDLTKEGSMKPGFYLLFIALFANIVSNRLIRKDEHLVRSMDRIR